MVPESQMRFSLISYIVIFNVLIGLKNRMPS